MPGERERFQEELSAIEAELQRLDNSHANSVRRGGWT